MKTDRRPIVVNTLQKAKRLLSRLILQLQKKEVEASHAKDLCYLLNTYISMTKTIDLEQRINELEKLGDKRNGLRNED